MAALARRQVIASSSGSARTSVRAFTAVTAAFEVDMRYPQIFRLLSPQRRANATEQFRIRFGDIRLLATLSGPPVDLRKAANGQSERMAAFGTAHFARERRGWA